jgi:hypothetical protein
MANAGSRKAQHDGIVWRYCLGRLDAQAINAGSLLETMGRRTIVVLRACQPTALANRRVRRLKGFWTDCNEMPLALKYEGFVRDRSFARRDLHDFVLFHVGREFAPFSVLQLQDLGARAGNGSRGSPQRATNRAHKPCGRIAGQIGQADAMIRETR